MITKLMHTEGERPCQGVAQHASAEWLESLRNGRPVKTWRNGVMVQTGTIAMSCQCLGCSRIVHSADLTDGETYDG